MLDFLYITCHLRTAIRPAMSLLTLENCNKTSNVYNRLKQPFCVCSLSINLTSSDEVLVLLMSDESDTCSANGGPVAADILHASVAFLFP